MGKVAPAQPVTDEIPAAAGKRVRRKKRKIFLFLKMMEVLVRKFSRALEEYSYFLTLLTVLVQIEMVRCQAKLPILQAFLSTQ